MNRTPVQFLSVLRKASLRRGAVFALIMLGALLAFEIFNYSTTDYALRDVLGDLSFASVRWATILSIAFCGIDFAGIARLFTPEQGRDEPAEVWYLFGAWVLAAAMNAILTWWGVSLAIVQHNTLSSAIIERGTLIKVVPVFVAVMVWIIRILVIGTFAMAGDRIFSMADDRRDQRTPARPASSYPLNAARPAAATVRPAPKPESPLNRPVSRPEPSYHPAGMAAKSNGDSSEVRR